MLHFVQHDRKMKVFVSQQSQQFYLRFNNVYVIMDDLPRFETKPGQEEI